MPLYLLTSDRDETAGGGNWNSALVTAPDLAAARKLATSQPPRSMPELGNAHSPVWKWRADQLSEGDATFPGGRPVLWFRGKCAATHPMADIA